MPATSRERHVALAILLLSTLAFAGAVPFARLPLPPVSAFIPGYEAALIVTDLVTALLLFGQCARAGSRALLILAAGYLFDALIIVPHGLSFPGLFAPAGLLGGDPQSTAWLYMMWHALFPATVLAYALSRRGAAQRSSTVGGRQIAATVALVAAAAAVASLLATVGHGLLPAIMVGNGYTAAMIFIVSAVWAVSLAAFLALLRRRPYSVLDLWLIVVMGAWLFDIALSAVLNAGRFDLGFYAGRIYGLMASSFVLGALIVESGRLHGRLLAAQTLLAGQARQLERRVAERTTELTDEVGRRRLAQQELELANRELSAIIEAAPDALVMLDDGGLVRLWSPAAERIFGYSEAEALGRLPPYLADEDLKDFRANVAQAVADASASGALETQRRHRDGRAIDLAVRWARVNGPDGRMLGIMYAVSDITERRKIEAQLHRAQKMEAIGNLTGGMAHDFNNHLAIIVGNLDVLRESPSLGSEEQEILHDALDAALSGAELTRRLLAFARRQPLRPAAIDANELIGNITRLLSRTLGEDIAIELELDRGLPAVLADPAQLETAIANLANNARDAMPGGGRLTIATRATMLDASYAAQHAEVEAGRYAVIEVGDTGCGMPSEVLERIFEPFFTTKPPGSGTGLGLSMVFGFLKQSGGHVNVYSEPGRGTIFRLYLRFAETAPDAPAEESPPAAGRGETILLVEDNAKLRRIAVTQLQSLNYRVVEADTADEALAALDRDPAIDLLFSDVVMPGEMDGCALVRVARQRYPELRVLLTSGFPGSRGFDDAASIADIPLLGKPYRMAELARAVRAALGETPLVLHPAASE
ncbi:MAG TPA: MASE4 domain-containing protein [Stellaceae bacterium]|nr:MASE4 domain-containing protein [Stellaceae bacterium]